MPPLGVRVVELLRRRPYVILFIVVMLVLAFPFCRRASSDSDWDSVYLAAARHLRAGEPIFQNSYSYPPVSAWLAVPFTYLPRVPARLAFYTVNIVALVIVLTGAWRLAGGGRLHGEPLVPRREHVILLLGILTGIYYVSDALSNQQTDLVLAGLLVGGCVLLMRGRDVLAALSFGIAAGMKCTPLLWAPYLVWRGRWRAALVLVVVAVGVNLLPDLTHPPADGEGRMKQWVGQFLRPMVGSNRDPGVWASAINFNHSVAGVCNRWLTAERVWQVNDFQIGLRSERISTGGLKAVVYSVYLLLIVTALVTSWRCGSGPGEVGEFGIVLILMLMLSPMSSKPHFCTLLVPGFFLARIAVERRELLPRMLLGAAIAAGLMSNKDLVGRLVYDTAIWYGSVFWNAVFLFVGCVVTMRPRKDVVAQPERVALAA